MAWNVRSWKYDVGRDGVDSGMPFVCNMIFLFVCSQSTGERNVKNTWLCSVLNLKRKKKAPFCLKTVPPLLLRRQRRSALPVA